MLLIECNFTQAANVLLCISIKQKYFQSISDSDQQYIYWLHTVWQIIPNDGTTDKETNDYDDKHTSQ